MVASLKDHSFCVWYFGEIDNLLSHRAAPELKKMSVQKSETLLLFFPGTNLAEAVQDPYLLM